MQRPMVNHMFFYFGTSAPDLPGYYMHIHAFSLDAQVQIDTPRCKKLFPECVARVPVSLGGLGVRLCSPKVAFATATVGNRSQPSATVGNRRQPSACPP